MQVSILYYAVLVHWVIIYLDNYTVTVYLKIINIAYRLIDETLGTLS